MVSEPRVQSAGASVVSGDGGERGVVPATGSSELSASFIELRQGASVPVGADRQDVVLYTVDGAGTISYSESDEEELGPGAAAFVADGQEVAITAGPGGMSLVRLGAGRGCDRHAPLGDAVRVTRLDPDRSDRATSNRSFQVLFDMHSGCNRATVFVGVVPPGRAPWHFHQYDEIVWILDGHGLFHLSEGVEEFQPGCAFRVHPREVHIVENCGQGGLILLGMFTPAGSPAAAYLAEAPR